MIVRIFRGSLPAERQAEFVEFTREAAMRLGRTGDMRDLLAGTRLVGDRAHALIASAWPNLEAELAALGDLGPRAPALDLPDWVDAESAEHFEAVGAVLAPLGDAVGRRVRVLRLVLRPNVSAAFFDHVRAQQQELRQRGDLITALMGRRTSGRRDEYTSVALWRDDEALARATHGSPDRPVGWDELSEWADSYDTELYDAVATQLVRA